MGELYNERGQEIEGENETEIKLTDRSDITFNPF